MTDEGRDHALRTLVAKEEIRELVQDYCRAVDRQDFGLLRALYTRDGLDDHGALFKGTADDYVVWLERAMRTVATSHMIHNHSIVVDGDRAEGEVYVTAFDRLTRSSGQVDELVQGLRYVDDYRREGGRWRFANRIVIVDWSQEGKAIVDFDHPTLFGGRPGRIGTADSSYETLRSSRFARGGGRAAE